MILHIQRIIIDRDKINVNIKLFLHHQLQALIDDDFLIFTINFLNLINRLIIKTNEMFF